MTTAHRKEFEDLYHRHSHAVYRLAMRMTGWNHADAQDVMQETFFRAFNAFSNYRDTGAEKAWIRTICINYIRELYRRKRCYSDTVAPEIHHQLAKIRTPDAILNAMDIRESHQRIITLLGRLPLEYREVLVLRHMDGRSTAETGEILGIPEGTVRSRLKRAREMMMRAWRRSDP